MLDKDFFYKFSFRQTENTKIFDFRGTIWLQLQGIAELIAIVVISRKSPLAYITGNESTDFRKYLERLQVFRSISPLPGWV